MTTTLPPTTATAPDPAPPGLEVRPVAGHIGAEIHGVDLREELSPEVVAAIRAVLLRWKVVFFRDQHIDRGRHVAFGRCFGEVTPAHPTLPAVFPDHPEVFLLDNRRLSTMGGGTTYEHRWHTDVTYMVNPPMGSILRAVVVPDHGGDTQWTNLAVAYERLSDPMKELVDGLHAVHANLVHPVRGEGGSDAQRTFQSRDLRAVHPLVRVHPETGEKVLFVNPGYTDHVVELSRAESRHLLALLFEHVTNPAFTVRFRWEPGSIAFWDNRATCHLAPSDVPAGAHRAMERITIAGDVPVGPDGQPSTVRSGDLFG